MSVIDWIAALALSATFVAVVVRTAVLHRGVDWGPNAGSLERFIWDLKALTAALVAVLIWSDVIQATGSLAAYFVATALVAVAGLAKTLLGVLNLALARCWGWL